MQPATDPIANSDLLFEAIRTLVSLTILALLLVVCYLSVKRLAGGQARRLGKQRYRIAGVAIALMGLLAVLRPLVEPWLESAGRPLDQLLNLETSYFGSILVGMYALLIATPTLTLSMLLVGWLYWSLEIWIEWYMRSSTNQGKALRKHLAKGFRLANDALRHILVFVVIVGFLATVSRFFPRGRVIFSKLEEYFRSPLETVTAAIVGYLPNLGFLIVIAALGWLTLRLVRSLADAVANGSIPMGGFLPEWAIPTYRLCRTIFLLFLLMVSYPYLPGADSRFFQGFSVFVGALVTFGSAGVISNLVAGIVLTYTKSFRIGDVVRIGGTIGVMIEKSIFVVHLRTLQNEEVILPSSSVLSSTLVNYSTRAGTDGLVLTVSVGIGYDVDWRMVHKLMLEAAAATENILADPTPRVWQVVLGDHAVNYELRATTDQPEQMLETRSSLARNVLDSFNRAGVEIMTPSILALRDASGLAVPTEQFPDKAEPHGIRIQVERNG